jgi:DNA-binding HxlR family transcriptional regulator
MFFLGGSVSFRLQKLYEDRQVRVVKGLTLEEIQEFVLDYLKKKGAASFYEIKEALGPLAGEDRLRRALRRLVLNGRIAKHDKIYYSYVPEDSFGEEY